MTTKAELEQMIAKLPKQHTKPGRVLPVRKRRIGHPEADEQAKVIEWAHCAYRTRSDLYPLLRRLHCSLNGVKLSRTQAGIAKGQGMLRGVPDLFLPVPRGNYAGLYIEMKRPDGGRVSKEQRQWLADLEAEGYMTAVCHTWPEAARVIVTYLGVALPLP